MPPPEMASLAPLASAKEAAGVGAKLPRSELAKDMRMVHIGCGVVGKGYVDAFQSIGIQVDVIEASTELVEKYRKEGYRMHLISDDLTHIDKVDFVMISVCTPLVDGMLEMKYLLSTVPNVCTILKRSPNALVVIRSTVPPLMSKKYKAKLEKAMGGQRCHVAFQPEFLRANTAAQDASNPWCVVLGTDKNLPQALFDKLLSLYYHFIEPSGINLLSVEEAELLKIFHNTYNAAKISFFNQCWLMAKAINKKGGTNINVDNITQVLPKTCEGLMNPSYGLKTGHGYYGTCLPKDSAEMQRLEEEYGLEVPFMKAVVDVNNVVVAQDDEEHLSGDHQMPHELLKSISSGSYFSDLSSSMNENMRSLNMDQLSRSNTADLEDAMPSKQKEVPEGGSPRGVLVANLE